MTPMNEFWKTLLSGQSAKIASPLDGSIGILPPLSTEEYHKKITELETVENWMKVNLQMLQMTIQTLKQQKSIMEMFETSLKNNPTQALEDVIKTTGGNAITDLMGQWGDWVKKHPLKDFNPLGGGQPQEKPTAKPTIKPQIDEKTKASRKSTTRKPVIKNERQRGKK